MYFCKNCLNPSTRPNIHIDEEGVCLACRYHEQRRAGAIDWGARREELVKLAAWGKANTKCSYDCIVPISGGKDSLRQSLYVRDELGLKPLLVSCVYPPEQITERGAYNLANLISLGFDTISVHLDPRVWKILMLQAFIQFANWCKSTELALYSIPIHVAIAYKIPLLFLGENPAYTIGERESSLDGDATMMKYSNTVGGGNPDHLLTDGVSWRDLHFYRYPSDDEMQWAKLRIAYLGYHIEDFNSEKNAEVAKANGLWVRDDETPEEIGDIRGHFCLDEDFSIMNQMIKQVKLGFGRVMDQVCEAIHLGEMDREEAIRIVKLYDGKCHPRYVQRFCDYLGISTEYFWEIVEAYRNKNVWEKNAAGDWALKFDFHRTRDDATPEELGGKS